MRQEPNNGIDLLLRQMGRRDEPLSANIDAQHLDADELNSYVANALPAATRARYTAHLADCSSCRKLIATLSASEVPVTATQPVSVVEPSGLKSFLASLFSPMVLRYAVPALGVIVLAVVGIVMLRNDAPEASIAQLQEHEQKRALSGDQPSAATATPAAPGGANAPSAGRIDPNSTGVMDSSTQKEPRTAKAAPADDAQPVTTASEPPPPAPKVVGREYATQPAEAEKKKAETAENAAAHDARRADEAVKQEARKEESVAVAPASGGSTGRATTEADRQKLLDNASTVANLSRDGERRADYVRPRKSEIRAAEKDSGGETVTVGGREFRKRGAVWVDTAYTIQSATKVARGSEQYRALVADEPGIHTIAETLKSEFIVVWKGRAYRIH
ncbi:MAG TPA: zf-HC2 domain-containing protein [Pyrinomonadaceae bacterium]|nr:zf-HC2 domain-containing protein [Pyrinomonadaceae bacterium]